MAHYLFVNKLSPEPRYRGGAEIRLVHVGRELCLRGHRVSVLCPKAVTWLPAYQQLEGMGIHHVRLMPDRFLGRIKNSHYSIARMFYLVAPFYVMSFLRRNQVDLIRDSMSPLPGLGLLAFKTPLLRVPAVLVVHQLYDTLGHWCKYFGIMGGLAGYTFQEMLKRRKLIYKQVICDGRWVEDYLKPYLGDAIKHIPSGVDYSEFQIQQPDDSSTSSNITILNVGRFVLQKGHEFLLKAMHILKGRGVPVKLVLAGDGPLLEAMQQLAHELDIQDVVEFLGRTPLENLPALLASADIFVLPSLVEGLPTIVLQAMAAGLPIVSADIPAMREVLNAENSVLVEPANEQALADGIQRLVADEQMRIRFITVNKELIQKSYCWEQIIGREIEVFESVLGV